MKRISLILGLLCLILAAPLFAGTVSCEEAFRLGENEAQEEHRIGGWSLLGFGSGLCAGFQFWFGAGDISLLKAFAAAAVPFVPAIALSPFRRIDSRLPQNDSCYQEGYLRKARVLNITALAWGELAGVATATAVGGAILVVFRVALSPAIL